MLAVRIFKPSQMVFNVAQHSPKGGKMVLKVLQVHNPKLIRIGSNLESPLRKKASKGWLSTTFRPDHVAKAHPDPLNYKERLLVA